MAINTTPSASPLVAYLPAYFETSQAAVNPVKWAYVEVFINAVSVGTISVPLQEELPAGTYNFAFDLQSIIQDNLAPFTTAKTGSFGTYNAIQIGIISALQLSFYADVTYSYINPTTGLLTDLGVTDTTSTYYSIAATRQRLDGQTLALFIPDKATPSTQRWLTNAPLTQNICSTDNAWISHICTSAARRLRVRTFNAGGGLIDEGFVDIDTSATFEVESLGVGIPNLDTITWQDQAGAPATVSFVGIYSYTIELSDNTPPYDDYLQTRTFILNECCDVARLHWFNLLGGTDAYTFKTVSSTITALDSQQAQKPLNKVYDISDKGAVKIASDSVETYTAVSSYLQPDDAKWLIEVGQSVEVYLETTSGLLPIIVTNTEIQSQKRTSGDINLVAIEVTYKLANNTIIQYA